MVGPRSLAWGGKKQSELAKVDFSELEEMLTTAFSLCGLYVLGDYDILVLLHPFHFEEWRTPASPSPPPPSCLGTSPMPT